MRYVVVGHLIKKLQNNNTIYWYRPGDDEYLLTSNKLINCCLKSPSGLVTIMIESSCNIPINLNVLCEEES